MSDTPPEEQAPPPEPAPDASAGAAPEDAPAEEQYEAPHGSDTDDEADRPSAELGGLAAVLLSRPSEAIRVAELRESLAREEAAAPPAPAPEPPAQAAPPPFTPVAPLPPPPRPRSPRRRALEGLLLATAALGPAAAGIALVLLGAPQRALAFLRTNDALEPNDRLDGAPTVLPGSEVELLRLDPTDVDWFAVDVPAGKALTVCSGIAPQGRAETSVHRADGVIVASSRGTPQGALERAVWWPGAGAAAERVFVRVVGARDAYTLAPATVDPALRFEPNDGAFQASVVQAGRTLEGIQGSGEDWLRVVVPPQRALRVRLLNAAPGISLAWARSASLPTNNAPGLPPPPPRPAPAGVAAICTEVTAPAVGAARALLLRVAGAGRYDLALDLEAPSKVPSARAGRRSQPKVIEGAQLEPNDVRATAPPVKVGRYLDLGGDGNDWYVVDVPADAVLTTTLAFSHRQGDIDLQLQQPDGRGIEASSGTDDAETATARLPQGGPVYIHVSGGSNRYSMTIDLERGQAADELGPGRYLDLQGSGNDLWLVRLEAGDLLDVSASWDPGQGHLDLQVLDQGWNQVGATMEGNWRSATEQLTRARYATPGPRVVFLRLTGTPMPYTLDLDVGPASEVTLPAGVPGASRPLTPGVHRGLTVSGESVWTIDVTQGQKLGVELQFKSSTSDVDLELTDAQGEIVASSRTSSDKEAAAFVSESDQTIRIRAYSYGPPNRCTMTVTLEDSGGEPALEPGEHKAQACAGRITYRVLVPAGKKLVASIAFVSADGDLDLDVRDSSGALLSRSETTEDSERVQHTATATETVTLVVFNATNTFDLTVALEDP